MSERKVLTKYYPPDWDPSLLGRTKGPKQVGPKVQTVRLMAPFSLRCTSCGEYIYRGRKFNARKETKPDEKYLSIQIYRFFIRCTRCSAEIVFRTEPRTNGYVMERGATRNTDPWRRGLEGEPEEDDEARLDRIEREMAEAADGDAPGRPIPGLDGEERDAMAELEAKTADAKREMAVADALDEIRSRNARLERAQRDGVEIETVVVLPEEEERRRQEEEDAEAARRAFTQARKRPLVEADSEDEEDLDGDVPLGRPGSSSWPTRPSSTPSALFSTASAATVDSKPTLPTKTVATDMPPPPVPSFKRQVKKKKDHSALLGIKKKQSLV